jgi:pimeloyl-ACP methyl ester carboxylesterase
MKLVTLSGWGQPHDALAHAFPDATHVDYAMKRSFAEAASTLQAYADAEIVVGWSMGGQLAAYAISHGIIAPKKLMLIAAPYQFIRTEENAPGVGAGTVAKFRENYLQNSERTLNKAYDLIAHRDMHAEHVKTHLATARKELKPYDWLNWYDQLTSHIPIGYNPERFPHTIIVHGSSDAVIAPGQAEVWHAKLAYSELHIWEGCGHAPHWHNAVRLRELLENAA